MNKEANNQCCHHLKVACVSLVPIFNHLEQEEMNEIMEKVLSVTYKKGEIIYRPGDSSSSLYIVHQGKIKIYRLSETGREILLRMLNPGDFTGELALFKETTHEAFAEAVVDTQVCMVNRSDLQTFLLKYPSISLKILSEFSERLETSEKQTTRFATEKVETRIALFLSECVEDQGSLTITLPMKKKDLASYLGTTPETVSRKLTELEEQNLIKQITNKNIEVLDLDELLLV